MDRLKMSSKAQCNTKAVRYYYLVGRNGSEKKQERREKMWMHPIICEGRIKW